MKHAKAKKAAKTKKPAKRLATKKSAAKSAASKKAKIMAKKKAVAKPSAKRMRWLDDKTETPLIDGYARQLQSFIDTMADGHVDTAEIDGQEKRLIKLMKKIEPQLDDELHAQVTELMCELTAYDLMQTLYQVHQARPVTTFQG
jgi:hypothetical protein